ncbi:hypothetical protein SAMN02745664_1015 [Moraxella cuniculi DSM 21768]|uniref:Porin n=1 Tax=Moraxella cuniculi DSM 21768 TaxID=1122245 RepID=A0A1N7D5T1_9GAMM|nr:hypothetical protein [Moraxella cuniculi]OOS07840.1 hypothetical protein B0189_00315 [Moraxella cuniculi]SIR71151.1 hypothetical protein SAMN02745664_1015 [Moraxella cuniculi DSM 21768]
MKTSTKLFRLSKLAMVVGTVGLATSSQAVYNIYKKNGLSLDINGQVDIQATKKDQQHNVLFDADGYDWYRSGTTSRTSLVDTSYNLTNTDKKPRLNQTSGVSYVEFRASQELPYDWRVTGNVGLGYSDSRDMYLNNSSISFDKKNQGAISIGRQYLHTNYVNRTGTDTPLDIFSSSALRLDYYGIKGLHTSAYYSFTGINDVREEDNSGLKSGFGASVSYRYPFADNQSVRVAAGYSQNKANPAYSNTTYTGLNSSGRNTVFQNYGWVENTLNRYPEKTQGAAVSLEYQAGPFLIAADAGRKKESMSDQRVPLDSNTTTYGTVLDNKKTDYVGAKFAYDINPVVQISTGYGVKKTKSTLKEGAKPLFATWPANRLEGFSYVDGDELYLFDKAKSKEIYAQIDYRIRPNVRLYTRYDREKTTYQVANTDYAETKDANVRAGVVFSF